MAINYSLGLHPVKVSLPNEKKVYAYAQAQSVMSLKEFSKHISDHGSVFDRSVVEGVLIKAVECLREQLLLGRIVQLGDMGNFRVTLKSNPTDLASEFTSQNICGVKVQWHPGSSFKNLLNDASFQYVPTLLAQSEARKEEKAALDTQQKNDSDTDSDNPAQGE